MCLIVPESLVTIPSPAATAVVPILVSPSTMFSSVVVELTPSNLFSSAAVDVTAVPAILSDAISKASVTSITAAPDPAPSAYIIFFDPATIDTLAPDPCVNVAV